MLSESPSPSHNSQPNLGLVCITIGDRVRFRTITRKRLLQFAEPEQQEILRDLYQDNLVRLQNALHCHLLQFPIQLQVLVMLRLHYALHCYLLQFPIQLQAL